MSLKQANYREILASFLGKIPHAKGWWYWLPSRVAPTQDGQPLPFHAIIPTWTQVLEFQIGKIDSKKDSMELLLPLVEKLGEGLLSMSPKEKGIALLWLVAK
jgi:hypothetical protein